MYDNLLKDAFIKALGPALIMIFAVTASLAPLYLILKLQLSQQNAKQLTQIPTYSQVLRSIQEAQHS